MNLLPSRKLWLLAVLFVAVLTGCLLVGSGKKIDFSADVKPIINKKCISCHGGVKAKGGFSLLFHDEALANTASGKPAIIPGNPDGSELIRRITHKDPEERMPYKHEPLSEEEVTIFRTWIKQGAKWGDHWAYLPVKEIPVPGISNAWVINDVDKFIYEKLEEKKLQPSSEADKATLLRRVSLDLIGMLPSEPIARKYLQSADSSKAYEELVDSLLASPHFGERWAAMWLDLARYADTKGYEADHNRSIWQYRDWVIKAFNTNMRYDEFLIEQIAGDLLPNPDDAKYIATAFHRNSMNNDEGGTNNEEFRTAAVLDRVNTTWEALMGTTFACVQCHSHPYDPFKHDEYYKFMAYFNNTRDEDVPNEYPILRKFDDSLKVKLDNIIGWIRKQSSDERAKEAEMLVKTWQPAIVAELADSLHIAVIGGKNTTLFFKDKAVARLPGVDLNNVDRLVYRYYTGVEGGKMQLRLDSANGPVIASCKVQPVKTNTAVPVDFPVQSGIHDVYLTYSNPSQKGEDYVLFFDWFSFTKQLPGKGQPAYESINREFFELLNKNLPTTPVLMDNPATRYRASYVFDRGAWRSKGKEVTADVPATLRYAMPGNAPKNRLGLAMWLTNKKNPLVSRTMVNRLWEQLFGAGIVETLEDMGTQGIAPTHKELLDHLSYKFMYGYNWDIKKLLKELVMSATYRQQSKVTDELKEKDMFNKYYARGPRIRLSAEQVRDQALCIAGIMSNKMYGPGVMPWQPEGIWLSPYNADKWRNSQGEDQYRRAIYTYWKRTAPYPSMISFDGAERVVCNARRIRTNTPLQALVTLNDSVYLDMSRHFAYRMQQQGATIQQQITKGYELMLYKPITAQRLKILMDLYNKVYAEFKKDKDGTCAMIGMDNEKNNPETAALVVVANSMLNLDEMITKN